MGEVWPGCWHGALASIWWGARGGNTTYGCGTPNTAGGANGLRGGTAFTAPAVWPLHFQTLARVLSFEERMQVSRAG